MVVEMNTNEILHFMENDEYIKSFMGGVLAKDQLPPPSYNPKLYVVNLDKSNERGSHWIALLLTNNYISEYFDPLGRKPDKFLTKYFNSYSIYYLVNKKQCQSKLTSTCGKFCLFYCYLRSRGKTMKRIISYFTEDILYNELFINNFYNAVENM